MNVIMRPLRAVVVFLVISIMLTPWAEAVPTLGLGGNILFDPDGVGYLAPVSVSSFNFSPGNFLAAGAIPAYLDFVNSGIVTPFDTIIQANMSPSLNSFLPAGAEITMVLRTRQQITTVVPGNPGPITTNTVFSSGGANFLDLYFDLSKNSSSVTGLGFNDGLLILAAKLTPTCTDGNGNTFTTGGTLNNSLLSAGPLSTSGTTPTNGISGGADFCATPNFVDVDFFPGPTPAAVLFSTTLSAPFSFGNAASPVLDGTTALIGTTNGSNGPDILLESNSELTFAVPEPSSISLLTLSFLLLACAVSKKAPE